MEASELDALRSRRAKNWAVTTVVHIWPMNDRIEHAIFASGCSCGAELEEGVVQDEKAFIITHNALDGRE